MGGGEKGMFLCAGSVNQKTGGENPFQLFKHKKWPFNSAPNFIGRAFSDINCRLPADFANGHIFVNQNTQHSFILHMRLSSVAGPVSVLDEPYTTGSLNLLLNSSPPFSLLPSASFSDHFFWPSLYGVPDPRVSIRWVGGWKERRIEGGEDWVEDNLMSNPW